MIVPMFDAAEYDSKRAAEARRKASSAKSETERAGYTELAEIFEQRAEEVRRSRGQGAESASEPGQHVIVYAAPPHAAERVVECSCGWGKSSPDPSARDHAEDMKLLTDAWLEHAGAPRD